MVHISFTYVKNTYQTSLLGRCESSQDSIPKRCESSKDSCSHAFTYVKNTYQTSYLLLWRIWKLPKTQSHRDMKAPNTRCSHTFTYVKNTYQTFYLLLGRMWKLPRLNPKEIWKLPRLITTTSSYNKRIELHLMGGPKERKKII